MDERYFNGYKLTNADVRIRNSITSGILYGYADLIEHKSVTQLGSS
jgi:hypothetical protein